jgi:hypothetical protein
MVLKGAPHLPHLTPEEPLDFLTLFFTPHSEQGMMKKSALAESGIGGLSERVHSFSTVVFSPASSGEYCKSDRMKVT